MEVPVRLVQVIPSGDVITLLLVPVFDTTTNNDNSLDQQIEVQLLSTADVLAVQFILSGDVITLLPVPVLDTATNKDNSGLQQIDVQLLLTDAFWGVQSIPLLDIITLLLPLLATAVNKFN